MPRQALDGVTVQCDMLVHVMGTYAMVVWWRRPRLEERSNIHRMSYADLVREHHHEGNYKTVHNSIPSDGDSQIPRFNSLLLQKFKSGV